MNLITPVSCVHAIKSITVGRILCIQDKIVELIDIDNILLADDFIPSARFWVCVFNINFKFEVMVSKTDIAAPRWNSEISVGQPSGKARDFRTRKDTLNLSKSSGVQVASFAVLSTFGTYLSNFHAPNRLVSLKPQPKSDIWCNEISSPPSIVIDFKPN